MIETLFNFAPDFPGFTIFFFFGGALDFIGFSILLALGGMQLYSGKTANAIAVGGSILPVFGHVCALLNAGGVLCWGNNSFGQLGIGNTQDQAIPTHVDLGHGLGAGLKTLSVRQEIA